jgi:hypothetical protein
MRTRRSALEVQRLHRACVGRVPDGQDQGRDEERHAQGGGAQGQGGGAQGRLPGQRRLDSSE